MKPPAFAYFAPRNIDEALELAAKYSGDGKFLAGGQSSMPALNLRLSYPAALIDLNRIEELAGISVTDTRGLNIRAVTRHRVVELSADVLRYCPLLSAAMPHIAHVQIRNRGTIGGSLSHADPAAELPAVVMACDGTMVIGGHNGKRVVPAEAFFRGTFTTALEPDEILLEICLPPWRDGRSWGFREINRRHGDFAIAGAAAWIDYDSHDPTRCRDSRIVLFGVAETPIRANAAENHLKGNPINAARIREAAQLIDGTFEPSSDIHASAEYRREVSVVLVRRALEDALNAGGERRLA